PGAPDGGRTSQQESFAEFRHSQRTEQNQDLSFSRTCALKMTLLMADGATFLQESSRVRHAALLSQKAQGPFATSRRAGQTPGAL
ncbi:hypothetical protein, partial [Lawsonibacter sp.]|uniref:hypothetical protein n=1 Tax=Lawsonibacter sp. TaxID=2185275 RepID=UPI002584A2AE